MNARQLIEFAFPEEPRPSKRQPTPDEERAFLRVIHSNFLVGKASLLAYPAWKKIDFEQTLASAIERGEIAINDNGVILSLDPKHEV
jgi:hypothetical protein